MSMSRKMRYGLGTSVLAGTLAAAGAAWACTPENGWTSVDNCSLVNGYCQYDMPGASIEAHAEDTFSRSQAIDSNWKLFIGTLGKWCMSEYSLTQVAGPFSRNATTGYVPSDGNPVTASIPSSVGNGSYDACFNNGDGGGDTAYPVAIAIV